MVVIGQGDGRRRAVGHGGRHRQTSHRRNDGQRVLGGACGVRSTIESEQAAGEELQPLGTEAAPRHGREPRPSAPANHEVDGVAELRVAGLEQCGRECQRGGGRDEPFVHPVREGHSLPGRADGQIEVTGRQCGERTVEQESGQALGVAEEPRLLDGRVEHGRPLRQFASKHPHPRQEHEGEGDEGRLSRGSGHRDDALGMAAGSVEEVKVELGARQVDTGVESHGQLRVRELVHQRGRLRAGPPAGRDVPAEGGTPGPGGCGRGRQWEVSERPGHLERVTRLRRDLGEVHPVDAVHRELQHQGHGVG